MKHWIFVFLLIAVGLLVYANAVGNSFIWDDGALIVNNPLIKNFQYWKGIFTSSYSGNNTYYRPLSIFSHLLEYSLWGLNSAGYHLVNIIIHILNALLIYALLQLVLKKRAVAMIASLLFLVHPIQTEQVTYISGRCGLLAAFFILAAFIFYILYSKKKSIFPTGRYLIFYILSLACFSFGLLSKESAVVLVALLILYDFNLPSRKKILQYLPFIIIILFYAFFRHSLGINSINFSSVLPGLTLRAFTMVRVLIVYIGLLFLPLNLHSERLTEIITPFSGDAILSVALTFLIIFFIVKLWRSSRENSFAVGWFFVTLFPGSQIIPISVQGYLFTAEHFLYLPCVGGFVLIACFGLKLIDNKIVSKEAAKCIFVAILIFYSLLTFERNIQWRSPLHFYQLTAKASAHSPRIHVLLGNTYNYSGEYDKAIAEFKQAIALRENYTMAYNNLGIAYAKKKDYLKARQQFDTIIKSGRGNYHSYSNLGFIDSKQGRLNEAIDNYKKAIKINPNLPDAYSNLGAAYFDQGLKEDARRQWQKALEIDPDFLKKRSLR
ncbi:MAG: tetratricopeptide repeat protein [Candidatus Omnitrophica bacterium]|nr:tetratricopeptide repeat protein [Candidatus Omnitrophota bacterium]